MDTLQSTARRLLEAMQSGAEAGMAVNDWVVFVGPEGGYQLIAGYEGSLDSLAWEHGAKRMWRLTRQDSELLVDGKQGLQSCQLRSPAPRRSVRELVAHSAVYGV